MISNDNLLSICQQYGTPSYVFDRQGFIENYRLLESTFQKVYCNYKVSYSYKTNYTPYICNIVKELGGYAEVVSDMEYRLAKGLGYEDFQIVYNGPDKGDALFGHLENHGILNVDNLDELYNIISYCKEHSHRCYEIGLRINLDIAPSFISRFGFEEGSEEFNAALYAINDCPNLKLRGIHCHISRARGLDAWQARACKMIRIADSIFNNSVPDYISLGSGMFGSMSPELASQFGNDIPLYHDYAEVVFTTFAKRYTGGKKPLVFMEPGTTLVSRFVSFLTRIRNIRTIRGCNIATVDGSCHNLGEICELKKLPFEILKEGNGRSISGTIDITGYTCLEQDVLYPSYNGTLRIGDILSFENVGGYSIVSKPQFIKPNCQMLSVDKLGHIDSIMRAETFNDVFNKFSFLNEK